MIQAFTRASSAIQFNICTPSGNASLNTQTLFGEGLAWGGMILVYLLDQSRRFQVCDCLNDVSVLGA